MFYIGFSDVYSFVYLVLPLICIHISLKFTTLRVPAILILVVLMTSCNTGLVIFTNID